MQEKNKWIFLQKINLKFLILLILVMSVVEIMFFVGVFKFAVEKFNFYGADNYYFSDEELEQKDLLEYEIIGRDNKKYNLSVKINSIDGIETVKYTKNSDEDEIIVDCNNKKVVAVNLNGISDAQEINFKIKQNGKDEVSEVLRFEIPRIKGQYLLSNGIYVNVPDFTGYNQLNTRYLDVDSNGELIIGNWINGDSPQNWYDYKNSKWANIYVEENGLESYYVWIPRYCYKLDSNTQRSDVKFIDVYNKYIDVDGTELTWDELESQGYQVPNAFSFDDKEIPGYWMSKYTVGERNQYTIDFDAKANNTKIYVSGITKNTTTTIAKYKYAVDGVVVDEVTSAEDFSYDINEEREYVLNVTAVGENDQIIGSMTRRVASVKVNKPELEGFNPDTTFYVVYDRDGNESSTVPISADVPENWYDYVENRWANIVTRNNGLETYYTWIPRYEYKLNQTNQRSLINFIEGLGTDTTEGYQIPEAFTFDGKEISGYWVTKYTVGL